MSTRLRKAYLKVMDTLHVKRFRSKSGIGHSHICYVDDWGSANPFYNRNAFRSELETCAEWLRDEASPVVLDVGANVGFWSTHLVQMTAPRPTIVFAFEPVPPTFCRLNKSVELLGLEGRVHPVAAAMVDRARPVAISYTPRDSSLAQVSDGSVNERVGDRLVYAAGLTVDGFIASAGIHPTLIKVDVEGSEVLVFRGAQETLSRPDPPALLFEFNPLTLSETGASVEELEDLIQRYTLFYVDDFGRQKWPLGTPVTGLRHITWLCNLFAVPATSGAAERWQRAVPRIQARLY